MLEPASEMTLLEQWLQDKNKNTLRYYGDVNFGKEYSEQELPRKLTETRELMKQPLLSALRATRSRRAYQVLSLGCGPGSDLLAVMQLVQNFTQRRRVTFKKLQCTGVDLLQWPLAEFKAKKSLIRTPIPMEEEFYQSEMQKFVAEISLDESFDFIILSFADVKRRVQFVQSKLPWLLKERGRIFVIDGAKAAAQLDAQRFPKERESRNKKTAIHVFREDTTFFVPAKTVKKNNKSRNSSRNIVQLQWEDVESVESSEQGFESCDEELSEDSELDVDEVDCLRQVSGHLKYNEFDRLPIGKWDRIWNSIRFGKNCGYFDLDNENNLAAGARSRRRRRKTARNIKRCGLLLS